MQRRQKGALSKVCGCCQRELQRRQIRQGGKRGQFCDAMGILRYGCSGRLAERAINDDSQRKYVDFPEMT